MKNRMKKSHNIIFFGFIVLIIGCAVVLTLVSEKLELQLKWKWDLTNNQIYSIGDTTKSILKKVDKPITIYTLYESGKEDHTVSEILDRYHQESDYIQVVNIDPIEKPMFTQQFETDDVTIEASSLIIREDNKDEFRIINAQDLYEWKLKEDQLYATGMIVEQRVTAAIASIQGGKQTTTYFVTGHGEMNESEQYYLAETLKSDGYKVLSYDLIYNDIPLSSDDCLMFLAPRKDLTDEEYEFLEKFVSEGGKTVCLMNLLAGNLPNFNRLFGGYGLSVTDNLIVEPDSKNYLNSKIMIRPQMNEDNPVLQSVVKADVGLVLPRCRGISSAKIENVKLNPILYSSKSSYGKVNSYTETLEKEESDTEGPFLLGAIATNEKTGAKIVLMGSSDFVSTLENAKFEGNIALFMDSVAWASGKKDSVAIQPKSLVSAPLKIKSASVGHELMVFVIIVIPISILVSGIFVWRRRLNR